MAQANSEDRELRGLKERADLNKSAADHVGSGRRCTCVNRLDGMRRIARSITDEDAVEMVCYIATPKSVSRLLKARTIQK